jgi:hypothetical protein
MNSPRSETGAPNRTLQQMAAAVSVPGSSLLAVAAAA